MDNCVVFLRVGFANVDFEGDPFGEMGDSEFEGDNGLAIGAGTKVTLYESGNLKVGGLAQFSWTESDAKLCGRYTDFPDGFLVSWSESVELELTEIQLAVGPTYQLMEGVLIYGGPFFHFVDGDLEGRSSFDLTDPYPLGYDQTTGQGKVSYDIE
jgi:hypothetical protein